MKKHDQPKDTIRKNRIIDWLLGTEEGTLSVCITGSTGENIEQSVKLAEYLPRDSHECNVLYLNTVQTSRQLGGSIRRFANPGYSSDSPGMVNYYTSMEGSLANDADDLKKFLDPKKIEFVIVNCWEMASKDHRLKCELIFMLNKWMQEYNVKIVVFAEKMTTTPESLKMHQGRGIGKLSLIATEIRAFKKQEKEDDPYAVNAARLKANEAHFAEYLRKPIPVWIPETTEEEARVTAESWKHRNPMEQKPGESDAAMRKRKLAIIASDMKYDRDRERYCAALKNKPCRVEEMREKFFHVTPEEFFRHSSEERTESRKKSQRKKDKPPVPSDDAANLTSLTVTRDGITNEDSGTRVMSS